MRRYFISYLGKFPAQCSHHQSAMVKCNGSDGDTSGQTKPDNQKSVEDKTPKPNFG